MSQALRLQSSLRPSSLDPRLKLSAFTLVEILVAVAVLMMLVVLVAQMVGSASQLTAAGHKRMDADDEARMVMDRIAADLAGMPKHPDLNILLVNKPGNDELYFLSRAPGYGSNSSGLTLVGYRVSSSGFQRVGKGLTWDDVAFTNPSISSLGESDYHTIAPSLFRMEYALLMKPGSSNYDTSGINLTGSNSLTAPTYLKTNSIGQALKDVAAIQVAIAVLDQNSRKIVSQSSLTDLANNTAQFPDFTADGTATSGVGFGQWISNAPKAISPPAAASQIRVYQRYFPLN